MRYPIGFFTVPLFSTARILTMLLIGLLPGVWSFVAFLVFIFLAIPERNPEDFCRKEPA